MSSIRIVVKPTAGGDKIDREVETSGTIREVKEQLAEACSIPADDQRLIYKGQILKDERTVESYGREARLQQVGLAELRMGTYDQHLMRLAGIGNDHVLHLVRGKPSGNTQR
jgi:hypothetical protein